MTLKTLFEQKETSCILKLNVHNVNYYNEVIFSILKKMR